MEGTVPARSQEGGKCRECQTRELDVTPRMATPPPTAHYPVGEHAPTCCAVPKPPAPSHLPFPSH